MKQLPETPVAPLGSDGVVRSAWSDFGLLTKARLSLMVVFTTGAGFVLGSEGKSLVWSVLLSTVAGTALAAGSAAALNQWMEVEVDSLMERTRIRPLPSGRMTRRQAFYSGLLLGLLGVGWLFFAGPPLAGVLAALTIAIYLLVYTPLKLRSAWCTIPGAVSGALPPVIGWVAAKPGTAWGGWVLFGILFFWQLPHFLAIAWMCREEYQRAGLVMISREDRDGRFTAAQAVFFSLALAVVSLVPAILGRASVGYGVGALVLNLWFFVSAVVFYTRRDRPSARRLFLVSIAFLPAILGILVFFR